MRSIILILIIISASINVEAQILDSLVVKPVFIKAGLLYDFPVSWGATLGIDFPKISKIKTIVRSNGTIKIRHKDLVLSGDLGFYHNPENYTAAFFNSFISLRHLYHTPWYIENGFGIGVMRTFYQGYTYTVDDNVKEHKLYGRVYGNLQAFIALGYQLSQKTAIPIIIQLRPLFWLQYPYNSFVLPHGSIELGIKYQLSTRPTIIKQVQKIKQK